MKTPPALAKTNLQMMPAYLQHHQTPNLLETTEDTKSKRTGEREEVQKVQAHKEGDQSQSSALRKA